MPSRRRAVHGCAPRPAGNHATASRRGTTGYRATAFATAVRGELGAAAGGTRSPGRGAGTQRGGGGRPPAAILLADGYPKPRWRPGVERGTGASPPRAEVTLRRQQPPRAPPLLPSRWVLLFPAAFTSLPLARRKMAARLP